VHLKSPFPDPTQARLSYRANPEEGKGINSKGKISGGGGELRQGRGEEKKKKKPGKGGGEGSRSHKAAETRVSKKAFKKKGD